MFDMIRKKYFQFQKNNLLVMWSPDDGTDIVRTLPIKHAALLVYSELLDLRELWYIVWTQYLAGNVAVPNGLWLPLCSVFQQFLSQGAYLSLTKSHGTPPAENVKEAQKRETLLNVTVLAFFWPPFIEGLLSESEFCLRLSSDRTAFWLFKNISITFTVVLLYQCHRQRYHQLHPCVTN